MINAYAVTKLKGRLEEYQYDPGDLAEKDVEIAVEFCGICHSDLSMIDNDWGISQYPLVPGHEVVGTIASVGSQVKHLKEGDSVGLGWHSGYCMVCDTCMSGDHNLCGSAQPTIVSHHGGFADRVRASSASVVKLPDDLDKATAGPLLCGGVTVFSPLVQFDIKPTDRVAVIGIGGLGHLALQFLKAWGCEVTAFTSSDSKKEEAKELGADYVVNSRDSLEVKKVKNRFDLIVSTVNVKLDWNSYISALRPKGRLHFVGANVDPLDLNLFPMLFGQKSVSSSPVGSPATISKMLDFAVRHNIKSAVERYKLSDVNKAIDRLRSGEARYRVVLEN